MIKKYVVNSQQILLVFAFEVGQSHSGNKLSPLMSGDTCAENLQIFLGKILLFHNTCNIYLFQKWSDVLRTDCVKKGNPKIPHLFLSPFAGNAVGRVCSSQSVIASMQNINA